MSFVCKIIYVCLGFLIFIIKSGLYEPRMAVVLSGFNWGKAGPDTG